MRSYRTALFALLVLLAAQLAACASVKPYEREHLARPCMALEREPFAARYREKVLESRAAGGLPTNAPGGGCGCTQ